MSSEFRDRKGFSESFQTWHWETSTLTWIVKYSFWSLNFKKEREKYGWNSIRIIRKHLKTDVETWTVVNLTFRTGKYSKRGKHMNFYMILTVNGCSETVGILIIRILEKGKREENDRFVNLILKSSGRIRLKTAYCQRTHIA